MKKDFVYLLTALALCIVVFLGDLLIERGYVEWLLYIVPLLLIHRAGRTDLTFIVLGSIGFFLGAGFFISPDPGIPPIVSLTDRLEGFVVFAAYTVIINSLIRSRNSCTDARIAAEEKSREIAVVNKELETFSYSVSHDLRNPLQAVGCFVDLLQTDYGERLDDEGRDYLRRIEAGTEKMNRIINDMLSLSDVSRRYLNREDIDLSSLASSILNDLAHAHPERHMSRRVQEGMRVHADYGLMSIALSNLLGNAWKYTGTTKNAHIEIGTQHKDRGMVYYIRDNGAGFDMRYIDSIFIPFRRLHSEREFSGTGIGLATVERVIQRHGGQVWAESKPGRGATFYFTLE